MARTPFTDTLKSAAKRAAFSVLFQRVANALVRKRLPRTGQLKVTTLCFSYNDDNQEPIKQLQRELGADSTATKRPSYFYDPEAGRRHGLEEPPARQQVAAEEFLSNTDSTNDDREFARKAAGGTPLRELPMCPQLERLNVLCDGRVVACCMDAMGTTAFGNVNNEAFEDIWRGKAHREVIKRFQCGTLEPCEFCTLRQ